MASHGTKALENARRINPAYKNIKIWCTPI